MSAPRNHFILTIFPPNSQTKRKERSHEALGIFGEVIIEKR